MGKIINNDLIKDNTIFLNDPVEADGGLLALAHSVEQAEAGAGPAWRVPKQQFWDALTTAFGCLNTRKQI